MKKVIFVIKLSVTLLTLIFLLVISIPVSANPAESDSQGLKPFVEFSDCTAMQLKMVLQTAQKIATPFMLSIAGTEAL